ncbi:Gag polyprotein, partial [Bienertia sinuspersici]
FPMACEEDPNRFGLNKRLGEEDDDTVEVEWAVDGAEEDDAKVELVMMCRIWMEWNVNAHALISTMTRLWNPRYGVEGNCIEKNLFFFQFHHWRDKTHVMEAQPWHFDRHSLVMSDVQGGECEVYKLGTFLGIDKSDAIGFNKTMKIHVSLDLRKPPITKINLKLRGGVKEVVHVKYEKLPLICYVCGRFDHGEKGCPEAPYEEDGKRKYGEWVRASPWKVNKGGQEEEGKGRGIACNIFITKKQEGVKAKKMVNVEGVTKCFEAVSLGGG